MKENSLLKKILLEYSEKGFRLFRNNSGKCYTGDAVRVTSGSPEFVKIYPGDVLIKKYRILTAGLGVGSPDLIGWKTVTITPDMVGKNIAVFVGIEAKTGKLKPTIDQEIWQKNIKEAGGISEIIYE